MKNNKIMKILFTLFTFLNCIFIYKSSVSNKNNDDKFSEIKNNREEINTDTNDDYFLLSKIIKERNLGKIKFEGLNPNNKELLIAIKEKNNIYFNYLLSKKNIAIVITDYKEMSSEEKYVIIKDMKIYLNSTKSEYNSDTILLSYQTKWNLKDVIVNTTVEMDGDGHIFNEFIFLEKLQKLNPDLYIKKIIVKFNKEDNTATVYSSFFYDYYDPNSNVKINIKFNLKNSKNNNFKPKPKYHEKKIRVILNDEFKKSCRILEIDSKILEKELDTYDDSKIILEKIKNFMKSIKNSYHKLLLKFHPDKYTQNSDKWKENNNGDEYPTEKIKEITEAYRLVDLYIKNIIEKFNKNN